MTTERLEDEGPEPEESAESKERTHRTLVTTLVIVIVLAAVYVFSAFAYRAGLDATFEPPTPPEGGVAVSLLPIKVDADPRMAATDVLIFPSRSLVDSTGRLRTTVQVDLYPTAAGGTVFFEQGLVPAPQKLEIPIVGFVQRYPFDAYDYTVKASTMTDQETRTSRPQPVPLSLSVFFKVPGWQFSESSLEQQGSSSATVSGTIGRAVPIMAIAVIFILLILMMGVLSVLTVMSGVRGRGELGISQAAWLTSATFALIALRNAFPGSPPLGSWIDILVFFWVITAVMLMIGLAVTTMLLRQRRDADTT